MPMPDEIVGLLRSTITIKWSDGHETKYSARDLRLACRCAGCIEETSGRPLLEPSTVPENVRAKGDQPDGPIRDQRSTGATATRPASTTSAICAPTARATPASRRAPAR